MIYVENQSNDAQLANILLEGKDFQDFEIIGHLARPEVGPTLVTPESAEIPIKAQGY